MFVEEPIAKKRIGQQGSIVIDCGSQLGFRDSSLYWHFQKLHINVLYAELHVQFLEA